MKRQPDVSFSMRTFESREDWGAKPVADEMCNTLNMFALGLVTGLAIGVIAGTLL